MSDHDLLQTVEQMRHQLAALRARLEDRATTPPSPEIRGALGELLEMLERQQLHLGLLREILARTSDSVFAKGRDGRYVMINRAGAEMFGKSVDEILGRDDTALFDRESADRIMAIDRGAMTTGTSSTFEETFGIRGVQVTLLTTETPWYDPPGNLRGLIGTAQDVTERRRAELGAEAQQDRLRSLASEIVIAEERSRQSLAADLHDGLGQDIALAKLKLSALRSSSSTELHDALSAIERLVEQADRSLRAIALQLSPPLLHDLGLVPALRWLAQDIGGRYGLDVRIEDDGTPTVADDRVRVTLYRAVRELLVNTATHAGAREAVVRLDAGGSLLHIAVEDEGAGFNSADVSLQGHGLFGIREQLRHVGGSTHIQSGLGRGTTVTLTVPFAREVLTAR